MQRPRPRARLFLRVLRRVLFLRQRGIDVLEDVLPERTAQVSPVARRTATVIFRQQRILFRPKQLVVQVERRGPRAHAHEHARRLAAGIVVHHPDRQQMRALGRDELFARDNFFRLHAVVGENFQHVGLQFLTDLVELLLLVLRLALLPPVEDHLHRVVALFARRKRTRQSSQAEQQNRHHRANRFFHGVIGFAPKRQNRPPGATPRFAPGLSQNCRRAPRVPH